MRYKVSGSAEMTDTSLVRARGVSRRPGASPSLSMVRESSVTLVSGASRIPFERSSRFRRFPWRCRSSTIVEQAMAMRKREEEVFPDAAAVDVGASSHWVAVPSHSSDAPVREFGTMTDDLNALADWLLACGVDGVALESTGGVLDPGVGGVGESRLEGVAGGCAAGEVRAGAQERRAGLPVAAKAHEPWAAARSGCDPRPMYASSGPWRAAPRGCSPSRPVGCSACKRR
jgi:hypothetical protein